MTKSVGVRQLKNQATQLVREVRETGAEYVITVSGEPVARLVPLAREESPEERRQRVSDYIEEVRRLAKEVGAAWTSPLSAAEAVAEQRREL